MKLGSSRHDLSSVELYRRGDLKELPYELSEPLDLSIWCALQSYVDYLELLDLERGPGQREEANIYGRTDLRKLNLREPSILEMYLLELRSWGRGEKAMSPEGRYQTALNVMEALFTPARDLPGRLVHWGEGSYTVSRLLWETGEEALEEGLEVGAEEESERPLSSIAEEVPLLFSERLAPLFGLLLKAMGKMVSQSEAARRLNLTPRGVALRIERGEMRNLRVGSHVLIPEEDVKAPKEERARVGKETTPVSETWSGG